MLKAALFILAVAAVFFCSELVLSRYYYEKTYRYYEASEVYWEDQNTLLLYLPHRLYFWSLKPNITLRAAERITNYGPYPEQSRTTEYQWTIRTNEEGFRGPNFNPRKSSDEIRVVCFGDSRTLGEGLVEKSTYPALLHEKLQAGNSGIRVINMAADGWSSHQGLALLKHKAVEYSPDIAIFCFGINDADQFWNEPDTEKAKSFDSAIVSIRRTLSSSLVYFSIQKIFLKVRGYIFGKTPMGMPESEPSRRVSLQQYKLNLEDITETCRKHQITPIFLLLPLNPYYNWSHWANSGESTGAWESNLDSLLSGYENQSQDHLISALKDLVAKKPLSYTARFALGNAIRKSGKAEEAHREFLALLDRVIFSEYTRASRKFAKEASVHLVDLTEDFHSFENSLFIDDMHPNALGAELIAQRMDDRIREFLSNGKSD